jgi:hypothetical protein
MLKWITLKTHIRMSLKRVLKKILVLSLFKCLSSYGGSN